MTTTGKHHEHVWNMQIREEEKQPVEGNETRVLLRPQSVGAPSRPEPVSVQRFVYLAPNNELGNHTGLLCSTGDQ